MTIINGQKITTRIDYFINTGVHIKVWWCWTWMDSD